MDNFHLKQAVVRAFTCGGAPIIPSFAIKHCVPIQIGENSDLPRKKKDQKNLYTWMPTPSMFVTLVKSSHTKTVIFLHGRDQAENESFYTAAPCCSLSQVCPTGTCLLGQCILDNLGGSRPDIRIMVFDVLQVGMDLDVCKLPAAERYKILRQECTQFVEGGNTKIQWAGDLDPARAFISTKLPHKVDCILELSQGHPCKIRRVEIV